MNGRSLPVVRFSSTAKRRFRIAFSKSPRRRHFDVALRGRAVDRERHLVDARTYQPPDLLLAEGEAVRARVEIDVRKLVLDVLAHLHGALVQEGLAVVEEVDADQRRPGLVDHPLEDLEIEHPRLTRARDAGFRRAARLLARDVAGGGGLDVQPRRQLRNVQIPLRRGLVLLERQLERAVPAELRAAGVQVAAQVRGGRAGPDAVTVS